MALSDDAHPVAADDPLPRHPAAGALSLKVPLVVARDECTRSRPASGSVVQDRHHAPPAPHCEMRPVSGMLSHWENGRGDVRGRRDRGWWRSVLRLVAGGESVWFLGLPAAPPVRLCLTAGRHVDVRDFTGSVLSVRVPEVPVRLACSGAGTAGCRRRVHRLQLWWSALGPVRRGRAARGPGWGGAAAAPGTVSAGGGDLGGTGGRPGCGRDGGGGGVA
jgi:hypothetical protein